jgi:hypothetical protein
MQRASAIEPRDPHALADHERSAPRRREFPSLCYALRYIVRRNAVDFDEPGRRAARFDPLPRETKSKSANTMRHASLSTTSHQTPQPAQ